MAQKIIPDIFKNARDGMTAACAKATGPAREGDVMFNDFQIEGEWFTVMDSAVKRDFTFSEAVSLSILCIDQEENDYYWSKISRNPANEQCGWCKDQFGVSWQIVPANMEELTRRPGAFRTLMNQKKIVIEEYDRE